ncbi:MAG TPA: hypothetical protein VFT45_06815 [Longimicrobium sp.]|nr:hypothetical protein [Longimicrobium sp.]
MMKRTPALVAAAAALGLLSGGLALEARASAFTREVSPHTVAVAWLTPGAPSPAGLELDRPGARWAPPSKERLMKLPPMRARASQRAVTRQRVQLNQKRLVNTSTCPRAQAEQAGRAAMDVHRS